MDTLNQILKNSAIAFCILSLAVHSVFAFINYSNGTLTFSVRKNVEAKVEHIDGFKYANKQIGEIGIKPTFL